VAVGAGWFGLSVATLPAAAQEWLVVPVKLSAPVREICQVGPSVYLRTNNWLRLDLCEGQVCARPGQPPEREAARDGIPFGYIAVADGDGIRRAWYINPTDRYGHGVPGDAIEAGGLAVEDGFGRRYEVLLPVSEVFEDIAPRIADINNDGRNEVITIRSSVRAGAAIAVYGLAGGNLIGSSELGLSATARVNDDRIPDLILPSADRETLRMVTAASGTAREIASVALGGTVTTAIGVVAEGPPPIIVLGLDGGRLVAVRFRND